MWEGASGGIGTLEYVGAEMRWAVRGSVLQGVLGSRVMGGLFCVNGCWSVSGGEYVWERKI